MSKMQYLPLVHEANFGKPELKLLQLLNLLTDQKLCEIFSNVCVRLKILLTNYLKYYFAGSKPVDIIDYKTT